MDQASTAFSWIITCLAASTLAHCPCLPRSIFNKATRVIFLKVKWNHITPLLKLSPPTSPGCESQSRAKLLQALHTLLGSLSVLFTHSGILQKVNMLLLQGLCPLCSPPSTTTLPGNSSGCLIPFCNFRLICHLNRTSLATLHKGTSTAFFLHEAHHYLNLWIQFLVSWKDTLPKTKMLNSMRALDLPCCNCSIFQNLKSRQVSNLLSECARMKETHHK